MTFDPQYVASQGLPGGQTIVGGTGGGEDLHLKGNNFSGPDVYLVGGVASPGVGSTFLWGVARSGQYVLAGPRAEACKVCFSADTTVTALKARLSVNASVGTNGNLLIDVWSHNAQTGKPGALLHNLASLPGTTVAEWANTSLDRDIPVPVPRVFTAGTVYWLVFDRSSPDVDVYAWLFAVSPVVGGQTCEANYPGGSDEIVWGSPYSGRTFGIQFYGGVPLPTAGNVVFDDTAVPNDPTVDLGTAGKKFRNLHLAGELKTARLESFSTANRPAASVDTIGRVIWDTDLETILVDGGGYWVSKEVERYVYSDPTGWDGVKTSNVYITDGSVHLSGQRGWVSDSRLCNWILRSHVDGYRQVHCDIVPLVDGSGVTVTTDVILPVGIYSLIGVG